jgi:pyrroloquinoline quinone biosynthesis protein B
MGRLTAIVLGSAAGGGVPQWNCRCPVCCLAWAGDARVQPRTQASIAISGNGEEWVLINASPDLPHQLRRSKVLHPRVALRSSPIKAVVLTGAEIDQIAGLLSLRERQQFSVLGTDAALAALAVNPVFGSLAAEMVTRHPIAPGDPILLPGELAAELFLVPGKVPLYLEDASTDGASVTLSNVGVEIWGGGARVAYIPGAAAITSAMKERIARADVVFFDGTLYRDDEMIVSGTGSKTARRMGHLPIDGADGSLAVLDNLGLRRIYQHINNTNPILIAGSPERAQVEERGWEIAEDGMEIVL